MLKILKNNKNLPPPPPHLSHSCPHSKVCSSALGTERWHVKLKLIAHWQLFIFKSSSLCRFSQHRLHHFCASSNFLFFLLSYWNLRCMTHLFLYDTRPSENITSLIDCAWQCNTPLLQYFLLHYLQLLNQSSAFKSMHNLKAVQKK